MRRALEHDPGVAPGDAVLVGQGRPAPSPSSRRGSGRSRPTTSRARRRPGAAAAGRRPSTTPSRAASARVRRLEAELHLLVGERGRPPRGSRPRRAAPPRSCSRGSCRARAGPGRSSRPRSPSRTAVPCPPGSAFVFQAITVAPVDVKMPCEAYQWAGRCRAVDDLVVDRLDEILVRPWKMKRPPTSTRSHSGRLASTIALIFA